MPRGSPGSVQADGETLEHLRKATLGEYEILGELGRGGMAIVYLAHDILLDKKVAIKLMNPGLLLLMGPEMGERFKREARTAAALEHPNVIPIHLIRETDRLLYFVMKYVEGRGLDSIMADSGPLPIPMALAILGQVGAALGYAHRRGVVHRDVKPANILIDTEGRVVVTDFGIAKVAEAGKLTKTDMTVGTPSYMSPEQCSARPVTGASDQYSLGIVGFEMISGKPPFVADSLMEIMRMHFFEPPPPLTDVRPDCPRPVAAAIGRMLAKDPQRRWPTIEAAVGAMGNTSLRQDDPVQSHLIDLAKSGPEVPGSRMSTPVSPTPIRSAPEPKTTRRRRPSALRRTLIWGTIAAVAVSAALGVYRFVVGVGSAGGEVAGKAPVSASLDTSSVGRSDSVSRTGAGTDGRAGSAPNSAPPHGDDRADSSGGATGTTTPPDNPSAVALIEIAPALRTVKVGGTLRLAAVPYDSRHRPLAGRSILWASRSPAIATVSQGVVTGVARGAATIEASIGKIKAYATITVTSGAPAYVTLSPPAVTVTVGYSTPFAAAASDSAGRPVEGVEFAWSSSDPAVAAVSQGRVTGVSPGTARITATTAAGARASAVVTVAAPAAAVLQVVIRPNWANVTVDGTSMGQRNSFPLAVQPRTPHVLRFERPGYRTVDTSVTVLPGDTLRLWIRMEQVVAVARAVLQMRIQPYASLSIDGVAVGDKPIRTDTLAAGTPHRLHFERAGYVTFDTTVTLQPGDTRVLVITMRRRTP